MYMPNPATVAAVATLLILNPVSATKKRGLDANDDIPLTKFGGTHDGKESQVSWQYNWDSTTTNKKAFCEYVPMLWGTASDHTSVWDDHVATWLAKGSTHLLGFNEPEVASQADLTVAEAVTAYKKYLTPYAGRANLGAPAVSNDGLSWIKNFMNKCSDCDITFIPIHWYNPYNMFNDFKNWVNEICDLGYPVWITEFEGTGTAAEQKKFMTKAIPWLDNKDCVKRYAYFGMADGVTTLLKNGGPALSALGVKYAFTPYGG